MRRLRHPVRAWVCQLWHRRLNGRCRSHNIDRKNRARRALKRVRLTGHAARCLRSVRDGKAEPRVLILQQVPFTGCVDPYAVISPRKAVGALDRRGQFRVSRTRKAGLPVRGQIGSMMRDLDFLLRDVRATGSDRNRSSRVACEDLLRLKIEDRGSFDEDPKFHSGDPE